MTDAVLSGDVSGMSRDCSLNRKLFIIPLMENVISALSRMPEDMPQWLRDYRPGDRVSFADFMSSRTAYYPGSGFDGCLVSTCNRAHCVHCFIQVDYGIAERDLKSEAEQFNANEFIPFPRDHYEEGPLNPYLNNTTEDALGLI